MTAELIQELVGLEVEKKLDFEYISDFNLFDVLNTLIDLDKDDAHAQIQAAIDKIKEL